MNVFIACPQDCVTGGVELLHQLAHELNKHKDVIAKIWYRGIVHNPQPDPYKQYNNAYIITDVPDSNSVLIFPEIWASLTNDEKYKSFTKVIYWESVDNYFRWTAEPLRYKFGDRTLHLAQSHYAVDFLTNKVGVDTDLVFYLTDYINDAYTANLGSRMRIKQVVYNPAKGLNFTNKIIQAMPDVVFKPIEGMTTSEVMETMGESLLYIDFGDHPGKDRMPREAAMMGCCIITGKNGSANYYNDISIPDKYKFDRNDDNIDSIVATINDVLDNYEICKIDFKEYIARIKSEKQQFQKGVEELVFELNMPKPRFSIIIPTHNAQEYIRKALDSIRAQVFTDYELIVICDACDDETEAIAKEYNAITRQVNFHCDGPTRSRGIDIARGDYLLFMDDDDWWLHEYVLTQLDEKLKKTGDPDILCFSFIFKGWKYASPTGRDGQHWYATWNKCWKRTFVGESRFPNVKMASDVDFTKSVFAKNPRIVDWDMPMYYYNFMRIGSQTEISKRQ